MSTRPSRVRLVARSLLGEVRRRGAFARELMRTSRALARLDERERAFATRLVLGVTAARGLLDETVGAYVRGGVHLEPSVADSLALATFELLFLSTPVAVAVNEGVELVRACRPRAAGLANAVLRKVAERDLPRRQVALEAVSQGPFSLEDAALVSGYPRWLLERVCADRGIEALRGFSLAATEPAPVWVRPNAVRLDGNEACRLLEDAGCAPEPVAGEDAILVGRPSRLAPSGLVEAVDVIVSDLSAQRVAALVAPEPGMRVLEVGQGRATKTLLVEASSWQRVGAVPLEGVELEPFKVRLSRERIERAGLSSYVRCHELDGRSLAFGQTLPQELAGPFERVLVDAPCSGVGTLRRHPEICWRLGADDVDELSQLQLELMRAASARVAPQGQLLYATCSIFAQEDERVVEAFLASPEGACFSCMKPNFLTEVTPQGPDGHFCARLVRDGR